MGRNRMEREEKRDEIANFLTERDMDGTGNQSRSTSPMPSKVIFFCTSKIQSTSKRGSTALIPQVVGTTRAGKGW